jgi:hypothetical protein
MCGKYLYSSGVQLCVPNYVAMGIRTSGVPGNFFSGGGSTNSVEDRGQRGQGSGDGSPLVRGSTHFSNE